MNTSNSPQPDAGAFFLPDLCQPRAALFLVLVAALVAIVLELAASGLPDFDWYQFSLKTLFIQWVVLSSAALLCAARPWLGQRSLALAVSLCFAMVLGVLLVMEVLAQWLLFSYTTGASDWHFDGWQLLEHLLIAAVLTGISLRYFYLAHQLQLGRQLELQARIEALQARIRPHFLFNSMNSIASLIAVDPEAAETAVEDLSALFRASLNGSGTQVLLADEIDLCQRYLRMEQQRLGGRLQVQWQTASLPRELKIPALSLQPLVENAVYHGIQHLPQGGEIVIEGQVLDGQVLLQVSNPVAPGAHNDRGHHMAQQNIHQRLQALYGHAAGLDTAVSDGCYRACLRLPLPEPEVLP